MVKPTLEQYSDTHKPVRVFDLWFNTIWCAIAGVVLCLVLLTAGNVNLRVTVSAQTQAKIQAQQNEITQLQHEVYVLQHP